METTNFSIALEAVKSGNKIARSIWKDKFMVYRGMKEGEAHKYFRIMSTNGINSIWDPNEDDILAVDWVMVNNEGEQSSLSATGIAIGKLL